ncbi:uncharacterized protein G2W53_022378 [Senna tora]|uniref:Uncharacterized protein n=1 Tax=Senna tora TaxID=362788 RepID=A0A834TUA2_9FABA|nr:uncharacterized protein G2W53_022378 [Senna tora]
MRESLERDFAGEDTPKMKILKVTNAIKNIIEKGQVG